MRWPAIVRKKERRAQSRGAVGVRLGAHSEPRWWAVLICDSEYYQPEVISPSEWVRWGGWGVVRPG